MEKWGKVFRAVLLRRFFLSADSLQLQGSRLIHMKPGGYFTALTENEGDKHIHLSRISRFWNLGFDTTRVSVLMMTWAGKQDSGSDANLGFGPCGRLARAGSPK